MMSNLATGSNRGIILQPLPPNLSAKFPTDQYHNLPTLLEFFFDAEKRKKRPDSPQPNAFHCCKIVGGEGGESKLNDQISIVV